MLVMTLEEATKHFHDDSIKSRFYEIMSNIKTKKRTKDGFEPGYQQNTGRYAGGRIEYEKQLREMGLVEIGKEYIPEESKGDYNFCHTDDFVQTCLDSGIDLSGNEQEAIKSGEYFKSIELEE